MYEDNLTLQADEVEAMSAIYGNDWTTTCEAARTYNVHLNGDNDKEHELNLQMTLPCQYPTDGPPLYQLNAPWMQSFEKQKLASALEEIYCNHIGESILYQWVEKCREYLPTVPRYQEGADFKSEIEDDLALERVDLTGDDDRLPPIVHGEPVTYKKSTFQAHLASIVIAEQVPRLLDKLKTYRKIANATHNMYAYRISNETKGTSIQDCDDDGEDHAGSRLLHLLQILDVWNVLVVVSRWYGGTQLGPDRFRYINNCARDILVTTGHVKVTDARKKS